MTVLNRIKNYSHDTSIASSFANLKEKLDEYDDQNTEDKN